MSEQEGFNAVWLPLPPRAQRLMLQEDARELREARQAEEAREAAAESRRAGALELYRQQAAMRGEDVSAFALATGQVSGRSVSDILTAAAAAGDREDAVAAARASREGAQPVHVEVGEPILHHGPVPKRGKIGMELFHRYRHWKDMVDARRRFEEARGPG